MNKYLIPILSLIVFMAGCSLAPDYLKPKSPVPESWPTGSAYEKEKDSLSTKNASDIRWQDFIADEGLRKTIETALDNNRDLRLAALNVQRARALYGIQRSELYPSVDANAGVTAKRTPGDLTSSGSPSQTDQYDVNMGIASWEIDFFGRITSLKEKTLEEYLATEEANRSARLLIVSETAKAYLRLARDLEILNLARTTFDTQEKTYHLIKRRFEVGIATELDVRRAQTQVENARRDIASYTQITAQDKNALNLLTGSLSSLPEEVLPMNLADVTPFKEVAAGISSEVLLKRPDIQQAEHRLKAAYANIGAARAALFPRITLTTTLGTASSDLSGLFGQGSDAWTFAPKLSAPMFDARLWAALDATKAEREIAVVQYEKAIQTAFREVADALAVRGTVEDQVTAQEALVNAAAETFRLSETRYDKGADSYMSVLDSQRSLYSAQSGLVNLIHDKLANQVSLYKVLGGGAD